MCSIFMYKFFEYLIDLGDKILLVIFICLKFYMVIGVFVIVCECVCVVNVDMFCCRDKYRMLIL